MTIILTLPAPPSANKLFRDNPRGGRIKSKLYIDWISHAEWRLREQRNAPVDGPVSVVINVERRNNNADIDNRIKPTLSMLVSCGLIKDDRFILSVAAAWAPSRDNLMRIAIVPACDHSLDFHMADTRHGLWIISDAHLNEEAA